MTPTQQKILDHLFPTPPPTPESIQEKYPPRVLPAGAMVTRIAPSPTGFMHIGSLYAALISQRLAHQSKGVFYIRIEDTDKKREVAGAEELIFSVLQQYGILADEGDVAPHQEVGAYGPYRQSDRADIYHAIIRSLLLEDKAYLCFDTPEELDAMRKTQETQGARPGYYGTWATWRNKGEDEVLAALESGLQPVVRFKSPGNFNTRISIEDVLRGKRELPENDQDVVIMKSDGLPTYHLAHVVDDHFMGTTHVLRGDEWFSSLPLHVQLFQALGWELPHFGHIAPIQKLDGHGKRKLSKRKDPEASMSFYADQGYPEQAIIEYLLNLANSNFEDWRKENPVAPNTQFVLTLEKLAHSNGPLFDFQKLDDISRDTIARMTASDVLKAAQAWAEAHDPETAKLVRDQADSVLAILNIERDPVHGGRKDIAKWSELKHEISYFFDDGFSVGLDDIATQVPNVKQEEIQKVLTTYEHTYQPHDTKDGWFAQLKNMAIELGFAPSAKDFKQEPTKYQGSVADVATIVRLAVTGRARTPDLHAIFQVMGDDRVRRRLAAAK